MKAILLKTGGATNAEKKIILQRLIGIDDLCEYIGYSKYTIYEWISEKRLPFAYYKFRRSLRFSREDVDKWINSKKVMISSLK